jgi:uncharacterized protein (TIGR02996 family)
VEQELLQGVVEEPLAAERWLVLADWLEENDDPRRAELLRLHRRLLATCCEPDDHPERSTWQARVVELLTEGVRPCVPRRSVQLGALEMTFAFVPPVPFLMGSPPAEPARTNSEELRRVALDRGCWLATHLVTQACWSAVLNGAPSHFKGKQRPAEKVSWEDCQAFCGQLGALTGQQFRLPTEAEWELACRAGTTTAFFFGATASADQANCNGLIGAGERRGKRTQTTAVGHFPPNAWGLYDMHGNVWEWCQDSFDTSGGDLRVLRGGTWFNELRFCRSASRYGFEPHRRDGYIGCRPVLCTE